jgi:hypothetical protein
MYHIILRVRHGADIPDLELRAFRGQTRSRHTRLRTWSFQRPDTEQTYQTKNSELSGARHGAGIPDLQLRAFRGQTRSRHTVYQTWNPELSEARHGADIPD